MAVFLVDYENECDRLLDGIPYAKLSMDDEIIFFYSKRVCRVSMEMHEKLEQIPAKKSYIKVDAETPNALDFQLVSYLGARIHNKPLEKYYILSKDKGYDCVCDFWLYNDVTVKRIEQMSRYIDIDKSILQ